MAIGTEIEVSKLRGVHLKLGWMFLLKIHLEIYSLSITIF